MAQESDQNGEQTDPDPYGCDACGATWNAAEMGTRCPLCGFGGMEA